MIRVGTSGFSYSEWKGSFYPDGVPSSKYLSFYAKHFPTTEINNTFYRIPSAKMTSLWAEQVAADFRFSLKLSQRITHKKRLREVDEEMSWFKDGIAPVQDLLGCVLVQLPPWHRQDLETLESFLDHHSPQLNLALEFRHSSWFQSETYRLLKAKSAALVVAETAEGESPREITGQFAYLRLRKGEYSDQELERWASWVTETGLEAYVYFKHDQDAPGLAKRFQEILS